MSFYLVENGRPRRTDDISAVDALLDKVEKRDMWEVVDFIVRVFLTRHPNYTRESAQEKIRPMNDFGATKEMDMRVMSTIPQNLYDTIMYFYRDRIEDKGKFLEQFIKRYPIFKVPDKL